jgi:hypothetical protein
MCSRRKKIAVGHIPGSEILLVDAAGAFTESYLSR